VSRHARRHHRNHHYCRRTRRHENRHVPRRCRPVEWNQVPEVSDDLPSKSGLAHSDREPEAPPLADRASALAEVFSVHAALSVRDLRAEPDRPEAHALRDLHRPTLLHGPLARAEQRLRESSKAKSAFSPYRRPRTRIVTWSPGFTTLRGSSTNFVESSEM
jgi:hypothetical protein